MTVDNAQFTEEQRAEAYRVENMRQVIQQTKTLESIRTYLGWLLGIVCFGIVALVVVTVTVGAL